MMKMKKTALLLLVVAAGKVGAEAQTVITAMACEQLVLVGTPASGGGTLSYQWYQGNVGSTYYPAIAGCNTQNCTIPAGPNGGVGSVIYRRVVMSNDCPADFKEFTITVHYQGIKVRSVCWAPVNVGNTRQWTETPNDYGGIFQFNKTMAWHPTYPPAGVPIATWPAANSSSTNWDMTNNNPCPSGWRLPTIAECQALDSASLTGNGVRGGAWVAAGSARGNTVDGRFYGPRANNSSTSSLCTITANNDNMAGCIFLPASGRRNYSNGALSTQGSYGYYWSSMQSSNNIYGDVLVFSSTISNPANTDTYEKALGYSARCVRN